MKNQTPSGATGFTLIELVIVVIVLGVLASVAIPKFINIQRDAKIAALSGIAGQLEEQSKIAHLRAQVDNIPEKGECTTDCNGHANWSVADGYYYILMADGSKLFMRDSYPYYSGENDIYFKPAMGLIDNQFVFVEGSTLKVIPRSWQDKLTDIKNNNFECYLEYENASKNGKNIITVHSADC